MRVLISGASGLIGRALTPALISAGHEPIALVRRAPHADEVQWSPGERLDPEKLAGADAIVHLAGKNVAGRWTEKFKQEVLESRVQGTRTLADAAAESYRRSRRPRIFISASGINYYGSRGDELLTEQSSPGKGFLAEVGQQWEAATVPASEAGVRVVNLRIGVVLAHDGGALKPMLLPFRLGLGGRIGSGKQFWSWISFDDVIGVALFALHNDSLRGPVNTVGPSPVRNEEFVSGAGKGASPSHDLSFANLGCAHIARRDGRGVAADLNSRRTRKAEGRRISLRSSGAEGCHPSRRKREVTPM